MLDDLNTWCDCESVLYYHHFVFPFCLQIAMEGEIQPREIQILETPEDIELRRNQVLSRYAAFKDATRLRRERLEEARKYMYFKRDADELESWINEKLQTASDESYRDPTNLQVRKRSLKLSLLIFSLFNDMYIHVQIFSCEFSHPFSKPIRPRYRNIRLLKLRLLLITMH